MIEPADAAFFHLDGELLIGNDAARGPWSADACHAGPVSGVLVRALEQVAPDKQLARVTLNFQRPIPIAGFRIAAAVERDGRSTAATTAQLVDRDGTVCAVASGLHLAVHAFGTLPTATVPAPKFEDAVAGVLALETAVHGLPFFHSGIEVAYPPGETPDPGPTCVWMRTLPLVEGERPSPFQSLCPLADCGNGLSRNSSFTEVTFVNPDLTIAVFRLPESDWLASRAVSFWEPTGIGVSHAQLFDTAGAIGYAVQTLLIRPA